MDRAYHLITSCDDNLTAYLPVQIYAIAHHLTDRPVHIWFLQNGISEKVIRTLEKMCTYMRSGGDIYFHAVTVPHSEQFDELARHGGSWSSAAYYPLIAHQLLPKDVDRALYFDAADTLVIGDISPYYDADFQGKSLIVMANSYKIQENQLTAYSLADLSNPKHRAAILRGMFNSGNYVMNLAKMRHDQLTIHDYQYLARKLAEVTGEKDAYFGDQGLLSAAFCGDTHIFGYPEIRNIWYMPYNFCVWYYDRQREEPDYKPAILHFCGSFLAGKPWQFRYPIPLRHIPQNPVHEIRELVIGQAAWYYLWHEYALLAERVLDDISS